MFLAEANRHIARTNTKDITHARIKFVLNREDLMFVYTHYLCTMTDGSTLYFCSSTFTQCYPVLCSRLFTLQTIKVVRCTRWPGPLSQTMYQSLHPHRPLHLAPSCRVCGFLLRAVPVIRPCALDVQACVWRTM